jgi:hypothetical protein
MRSRIRSRSLAALHTLCVLLAAALLAGLAVWWAHVPGASGSKSTTQRLARPPRSVVAKGPEEEALTPVPHLYLPLVITESPSRSNTHHALRRPTNVYLSRRGSTYAEALSGPLEVRPEPLTTGAWNSPPDAYYPYYTLTRGFFFYNLGELAGRTVISAALDVRLCAAQTPSNAPLTLTLHAGTWTDAITPETWEQVGAVWGTVTLPPDHDLPAETRRLTLPLSGTLPSRLRLVWRTDEQAYPDGVLVGAAFDLADCYAAGLAEDELTTLHLWIAEGEP